MHGQQNIKFTFYIYLYYTGNFDAIVILISLTSLLLNYAVRMEKLERQRIFGEGSS